MRVAGSLSKDPDLVKSYRNGIDLHSLNAKICFNIKIDLTDIKADMAKEGFKEGTEVYEVELLKRELFIIKRDYDNERTAAKSVSFGILYGMSEYGLKWDLDAKTRNKGKIWTLEECKTLIRRFHENFKRLSLWIKETQMQATKDEFIANAFGFRRPLPQIKSKNWKERGGALRMAVNTPIQGTASLIMVLGIATMRRRLDPTKARLVMTVHDSVVAEVRDDYVEEAARIMKDSLENPVFQGKTLDFLAVPLLAEFEVGAKYGALSKYKVVERAA